MGQRASTKESGRDVVQGRKARSHRKNGAQAAFHTSTSRHASLRPPRDQQNLPTGKPKILVARYATRRNQLCQGMCGLSTTQGQYQTNESHALTYIPRT